MISFFERRKIITKYIPVEIRISKRRNGKDLINP